MIKWKAVIIGLILTIIFALILNPFIGEFGSYLSIVIAGMIIGYLIKGSLINGAIHGVLIGIIGTLFAVIILFVVGGFLIINAEMSGLLIRAVIDVFSGALGGTVGTVLIRRKH